MKLLQDGIKVVLYICIVKPIPMLSKSCKYAIRATLYVAAQSESNSWSKLGDIANAIQTPVAFTAKILQTLVKNNIIESTKGRSGGFFISKSRAEETKLKGIVDVFDGEDIYTGCVLGLDGCNDEKPCPAHDDYVIIRNDFRRLFENTSIAGLSADLKAGTTFLKH